MPVSKNKMKPIAVFLLFSGIVSCSVTENSVAGVYTSSRNEKLRLNKDNTFSIVFDVIDSVTNISKGIEKVTGIWKFKNRKISLEVNDKRFKFWECYDLETAPKALKRPDKCGKFNKYIFFRKDK